MYEGFWRETVIQNLWVPLLVVAFSVVIGIAKHYADLFVKMFTERQKVESVEKIASARQKLTQEIDSTTEAAVASTMDMVDNMKKSGKKLTQEQIATVNDSAKSIVFKSLPLDISGMTPSEILGGEDVLNIMIDAAIEKYVLDYKIKRGIKTNTSTGVEEVSNDSGETSAEPIEELTQCQDDLISDAEQFPEGDTGDMQSPDEMSSAIDDPNYGRDTNDGSELVMKAEEPTAEVKLGTAGIMGTQIKLQIHAASDDGSGAVG
ncbi:MAG: hypothetical protein NC131_10045 [Roseburia sp.]|nr:hypothetical protein [Roseburia sp.]